MASFSTGKITHNEVSLSNYLFFGIYIILLKNVTAQINHTKRKNKKSGKDGWCTKRLRPQDAEKKTGVAAKGIITGGKGREPNFVVMSSNLF